LIDGIKSSEVRDQDPNQLGKRHRCVRAGDAPELVTSDVKITSNPSPICHCCPSTLPGTEARGKEIDMTISRVLASAASLAAGLWIPCALAADPPAAARPCAALKGRRDHGNDDYFLKEAEGGTNTIGAIGETFAESFAYHTSGKATHWPALKEFWKANPWGI
jgi:hypothetical protein